MKSQNLGKRQVLIADDDDDSRAMLAFLLEEEGWNVREARDGLEALEELVNQPPDLLILDNRMPQLTGIEVYKQIRKLGVNLTVILVTAYGHVEELATSVGISYSVSKPYDITELLNIIETAYENSSGI